MLMVNYCVLCRCVPETSTNIAWHDNKTGKYHIISVSMLNWAWLN